MPSYQSDIESTPYKPPTSAAGPPNVWKNIWSKVSPWTTNVWKKWAAAVTGTNYSTVYATSVHLKSTLPSGSWLVCHQCRLWPKGRRIHPVFKIVQNKLHYAAHGHTAAEVIFERANAEKPFMGLTTFPGEQPRKEDVLIAKTISMKRNWRYWTTWFPDTSTSQKYKPSNVRPCICRTIYITWTSSYRPPESKFCRTQARSLTNKPNKSAGRIPKYHVKTLSPVEEAYFDSIKKLTAETKKKKKK